MGRLLLSRRLARLVIGALPGFGRAGAHHHIDMIVDCVHARLRHLEFYGNEIS
ncbi:MAG: hypothetical protein JJ864_05545 [Rhizobiaceae bacterium]|nr:hypothetical protein [Rhizobiaceae bacterium]